MAGIDSFTTLCVHFDGANGSTTYVDSSSANNPVFDSTEGGYIDTSTFEFGGASYNNPTLNGLNCVYSVANSAAYSFGTGDFVIDLWFNPAGFTSCALLDFGFNVPGQGTSCPLIYMNGAELCWYFNGGIQIGGATLSAGTWYHIAVVRSSSVTRLFVNGTQSGSDYADTNNYGSDPGVGWMLGAVMNGGGAAHAPQVLGASQSGHFDELRFSKGTDRGWFSGFTPPTTAYSAATSNSFNQSVSITSTTAASFLKRTGKITAITSSSVSTFIKKPGKTVPVTSTSSTTSKKTADKIVPVTSTTSTALSKVVGHIASIASTTTATFSKVVSHVVSVGSTTATTFTKAIGHAISIGSTTTTSFAKSVGHTVSVASTSLASFIKSIGHLVSVDSTTATTSTFGRAVNQLVSITATTTTALNKWAGKVVSVSSTSATTFNKGVSHLVSINSSSLVSLRKAIGYTVSISSTTVTSAAGSTGQALSQAVSAIVTSIVSVITNFIAHGNFTTNVSPARTVIAAAQTRSVQVQQNKARLVALMGQSRVVQVPAANFKVMPTN